MKKINELPIASHRPFFSSPAISNLVPVAPAESEVLSDTTCSNVSEKVIRVPVEPTIAPVHRTIALDENKRHFVFGDIHGRYATFRSLLEKIGYDSSTDVIYSVGDMIDRGPDSVSVVKFFQQPHCHAILGNHEQMVLNLSDWAPVWADPWNGGPATLASLASHGYSLDWLVSACKKLSVCLDIGDDSQSSAFRIIHAESPLEWSEEELLHYLSNSTRHDAAEGRLTWGRNDIESLMELVDTTGSFNDVAIAEHRSPRPVYCGHTPITDVFSAFNVNWIDTAAGGVMTCMDPVSLRKFQVQIDPSDWF